MRFVKSFIYASAGYNSLREIAMAQLTSFDPLYWDDPYPIALMLRQIHPHVDPIAVELETLQHWVTQLDGFADDPSAMMIERLEDIQVEWIDLR